MIRSPGAECQPAGGLSLCLIVALTVLSIEIASAMPLPA